MTFFIFSTNEHTITIDAPTIDEAITSKDQIISAYFPNLDCDWKLEEKTTSKKARFVGKANSSIRVKARPNDAYLTPSFLCPYDGYGKGA